MHLDAINDGADYEISSVREKSEASDGERTYILLESGEYCNSCFKNPRMKELGIEKISFKAYQLAEEKLFSMDFKVAANNKKMIYLQLPNKMAFAIDNLEIFEEVKRMASIAGAAGLERIANQAVILSSRPRPFPPNKDSAYLRCMDGCDNIESEPFKLLCYAACTVWADDKPGS